MVSRRAGEPERVLLDATRLLLQLATSQLEREVARGGTSEAEADLASAREMLQRVDDARRSISSGATGRVRATRASRRGDAAEPQRPLSLGQQVSRFYEVPGQEDQ